MVNIAKPETCDLEQIRNILIQWTEAREVKKYLTRISNEIEGRTEFNMQFWVAKQDRRAVGIIGLCAPLPKLLPLAQTNNPGEIKILYVDTGQQGKGIGRKLIDFVENDAGI